MGRSFDSAENISPAFTGTPTAPTPALNDNSTKIATTAFVRANGTTTFKGGTFTRLMSSAGGNQSITGIGFVPRYITFQTGISGGAGWGSVGQSDGASNNCLEVAVTTGGTQSIFPQQGFSGIQRDSAAGTSYNTFTVASFDADGFTVTWSKVGTPTNTALVMFTCYR